MYANVNDGFSSIREDMQKAIDLYKIKDTAMIMGAEMWEADGQEMLNEYAKKQLIDKKAYQRDARLWHNTSTDYMPLLDFAVQKKLNFICTNIPRRYANMVLKRGEKSLDSISPNNKKFLPPLPLHFNPDEIVYQKLYEGFKHMQATPMKGSDVINFIKAQALKDATMAYLINKNMQQGDLFFHFNGEYHSAFHSGIVYYLKYYNPKIKVKTISTISQNNIFDFKAKDSRADFNILIPKNMTPTYEE